MNRARLPGARLSRWSMAMTMKRDMPLACCCCLLSVQCSVHHSNRSPNLKQSPENTKIATKWTHLSLPFLFGLPFAPFHVGLPRESCAKPLASIACITNAFLAQKTTPAKCKTLSNFENDYSKGENTHTKKRIKQGALESWNSHEKGCHFQPSRK
jgi:hypothetical protein